MEGGVRHEKGSSFYRRAVAAACIPGAGNNLIGGEYLIAFIIGFLIGGALGMVAMALVAGGARADRITRELLNNKEDKHDN